jgi:hypothetical protein
VHLGLRSARFLAPPITWAGSPLLKSRGALADGTGRRRPVDSIDGQWRGSGGWRLERLRRAGNQFGGRNRIERSSPMLSMTVNLDGRGTPVREVGRRSLVRLARTWSIAGRQRSSVRCRCEGGDCISPKKPAALELGLADVEAARRRWRSSGGLGGGSGVGGGQTLLVDNEVLAGRGKWQMVPTASVLMVALCWLEARTARWRPPCSPGAVAMVLGARRLSAYGSSTRRSEHRLTWSGKRRKQPLLLDEGLQWIRETGLAHVEVVLHGLRVEAGRSRWHGAVR